MKRSGEGRAGVVSCGAASRLGRVTCPGGGGHEDLRVEDQHWPAGVSRNSG